MASLFACKHAEVDVTRRNWLRVAEDGYLCSGNSAKVTFNKLSKKMIRYKKYQNKNSESPAFGKWYGRAVHELMEFDEFIEHMANHHCAFSEATIRGVLIEMECCLRELLLEGKAVRIDELGIFTVGLETEGTVTSKEFTADNIKSVRMNIYLGKRFRAKQLREDAKFKEADKYVGDLVLADEDEDDGPLLPPSGGGW